MNCFIDVVEFVLSDQIPSFLNLLGYFLFA